MASMRTILSSKRFAAWLEAKAEADPHGSYEYFCNACAIGQYLQENGITVNYIGSTSFYVTDDTPEPLPENWDRVASGYTPGPGERPYPTFLMRGMLRPGWTWDAAAARARKLLLGGRTRKAKAAAQ